MGQYVNNNIVDLGDLDSSYDLDNAVAEIGDLIGVGARTSGTYAGRYVMADLFVADFNKWTKFRPIPVDKTFNITEEDRKAANYGYSFVRVLAWNADLINEQQGWEEGNLKPPYRFRDFDGYNHVAKPPIDMYFEDKTKVKMLNTTFGVDLPDIVVVVRRSASIFSSALADSDIGVEDVSVTYPSGVSLAGFMPCVIAYKDGVGYRCANLGKKINEVTAANADSLRIRLSEFNIADAFKTGLSQEEIDGLPEGATNWELLTLYPKLNNYTDLESRRLYSNDDSTPFGSLGDATQTYGNGFIRQISTAIGPVPDATALKIVRFNMHVANADYTYISISEGGVSFISAWLYDYTTNFMSPTLKVANLGGKTLHFSSKEVRIMVNITLYNVYNKTVYARPTKMEFGAAYQASDIYIYNLDYITIAPGSSASAQIYGVFPAGSGSDFSFSSYTSPNAGTTNCTVHFEFGEVPDKYGSSLLVPYHGAQKFLAWR